MSVQLVFSVESFTADITRKLVNSSMNRSMTISILCTGKCFRAEVALISYNRMLVHVEL